MKYLYILLWWSKNKTNNKEKKNTRNSLEILDASKRSTFFRAWRLHVMQWKCCSRYVSVTLRIYSHFSCSHPKFISEMKNERIVSMLYWFKSPIFPINFEKMHGCHKVTNDLYIQRIYTICATFNATFACIRPLDKPSLCM